MHIFKEVVMGVHQYNFLKDDYNFITVVAQFMSMPSFPLNKDKRSTDQLYFWFPADKLTVKTLLSL